MAEELTSKEQADQRFVGTADEFEFIGMEDEVEIIEVEED